VEALAVDDFDDVAVTNQLATIPFPGGRIECQEDLGGLLKHYYRAAARGCGKVKNDGNARRVRAGIEFRTGTTMISRRLRFAEYLHRTRDVIDSSINVLAKKEKQRATNLS
jgi:hypothetical protein